MAAADEARLAATTARGTARYLLVAGGGGLCLVLGVALLVLPGPGLPLVALGLALLAVAHAWARRAPRTLKMRIARLGVAARTRWHHRHDTDAAVAARTITRKEEAHAHQADRS